MYCGRGFHHEFGVAFLSGLLVTGLHLPLGLLESRGFLGFSEEQFMSSHVVLFDNLSAIFIHVYEASAAAGDE
jgi:hypothetical protein